MSVLSPYVTKDTKWRNYAFSFCKCHDFKDDMVSELYIKIHDILTRTPDKQLGDSYIYLMLRSIYIDSIRNNNLVLVDETILDLIEDEEPYDSLDDRKWIDEALKQMSFLDREVLLLTQEKSLRTIEKESGVNYQAINKIKLKALPKLEKILNGKKKAS